MTSHYSVHNELRGPPTALEISANDALATPRARHLNVKRRLRKWGREGEKESKGPWEEVLIF